MFVQMNGIDQLLHDIHLGRDWLVQMGFSASQNNITIQYRMAYPRQTLQALEIPAVTQVVLYMSSRSTSALLTEQHKKAVLKSQLRGISNYRSLLTLFWKKEETSMTAIVRAML